EDVGAGLNAVSTDPQHNVPAGWNSFDGFERHSAVGNGVHRAFGLLGLDALGEEAGDIDILRRIRAAVLDVDFVNRGAADCDWTIRVGDIELQIGQSNHVGRSRFGVSEVAGGG